MLLAFVFRSGLSSFTVGHSLRSIAGPLTWFWTLLESEAVFGCGTGVGHGQAILPRQWERFEEELLGKQSRTAIPSTRPVVVHTDHGRSDQNVYHFTTRARLVDLLHEREWCIMQEMQLTNQEPVLAIDEAKEHSGWLIFSCDRIGGPCNSVPETRDIDFPKT